LAVGSDGRSRIECQTSSTLFSRPSEATRISLWNVKTGKEVLPFVGHKDCVETLAFSADGAVLASASLDGRILLWDKSRGWKGRIFKQLGSPTCLAFSPDGKTVAAGTESNRAILWDLATGQEVGQLVGHGRQITSLSFSPDGETILSGGADQTVRLWNRNTCKQLLRIEGRGEDGQRASGAFSMDGRVFATATSTSTVDLWETSSGKLVRELKGGKDELSSVVFSPDGKVLAASGRRSASICVWDITLDNTPQRWNGRHITERFSRWWVVRSSEGSFGGGVLAFSPDGTVLATGSSSDSVRLWEVTTGRQLGQFDTRLRGYEYETTALAFSPDGRQLATGGNGDCAIMIWDVTGQEWNDKWALNVARDLTSAWSDLARSEARAAHRALWGMVSVPGSSVPFLKERLKPVPVAPAELVHKYIEELNDDKFQVREAANGALEELSELAHPLLHRTLENPSSQELHRRVERLLRKEEGLSITPRQLQAIRAIAILERIGSPETIEVLKSLAAGASGALLTQEAKSALERVARRCPVVP
jgi:WD40 repeat protein